MTDMSDAVFSCGRPEELEQFGLAVGMRITLVELKNLQERYGFEAILYFDEDLARNSTLGDDAADFRILPVQARPFMPLAIFLQVMAKHDPEFTVRMQEEPPAVEILETGTSDSGSGCVQCIKPYVKGLLL